ncbi:MAG: site-specific integrase [Candidatus Poriferisodalaceae bacterium]
MSRDVWNVDEFLRFLTAVSPATIEAYRQDLSDFIRWSEESGYRTPGAISRNEVESWIAGMLNNGRARRKQWPVVFPPCVGITSGC